MPLGCMGSYIMGIDKVGGGTCGLPGTFNKTAGITPGASSTSPIGPIGRST